jgi:hypothetical protein
MVKMGFGGDRVVSVLTGGEGPVSVLADQVGLVDHSLPLIRRSIHRVIGYPKSPSIGFWYIRD